MFISTSLLLVFFACVLHQCSATRKGQVGPAPPAIGNWSYFYAPNIERILGVGPNNWHTLAHCNGKLQSPIDFKTEHFSESFPVENNPLIFSPVYSQWKTPVVLVKDPDTVDLRPTAAENSGLFISGADLVHTYRLFEVHFHWGGGPWRGSEHTIDGKAFPMEMHLVHVRKEFRDIKGALASEDGSAIAVLGVWLQESENDNAVLNTFLGELRKIGSMDGIPSPTINVKAPLAISAFLPSDISRFFRYSGSLTVPPCNEVVEWIMFTQTVPVSQRQLGVFRNVFLPQAPELPMYDNWRPVQPLNQRFVKYFGPSTASAGVC